MIRPDEWYRTWFDSEYYHILYKNRDFEEAEQFINNLIDLLKPKENSFFLDLGCGKGRHSLYLSHGGYNVLGVDLSLESILIARQKRKRNLSFNKFDMRNTLAPMQFDYIVNLFTSFGYFDNEEDNFKVIKNVKEVLLPNGKFIIDFFNAEYVKNNLVAEETKVIDDIQFNLKRSIVNNFVVKNIVFENKGIVHNHTEKVKLIGVSDFENYFMKAGLKIINKFGDYNLNTFDVNDSKRLILIAGLNP